MISRVRVWSKQVLPRAPVLGAWFERGFRRREGRYRRRQKLAELQTHRAIAREWRRRLTDVLASPDNSDIPRAANAGMRCGDDVIMHNGLRVAYGSYGFTDTEHTMRVLECNRGVHEPQEEKMFQQVLRLIPQCGVMLELGSFWGFYSMWFARDIPDARCYLIEPVWAYLNAGRLNFGLNGLQATFIHASIGARERRQAFGPPVLTVDRIMRDHRLDRVHVLHSDIQGSERDMLEGAAASIAHGKIDWLFISTHSNELHGACLDWLDYRGWNAVACATLDESFSVDGLIVAHRPGLDVPPLDGISLKTS